VLYLSNISYVFHTVSRTSVVSNYPWIQTLIFNVRTYTFWQASVMAVLYNIRWMVRE